VKVLALDYADDPKLRRRAIDRAKAAGFLPFVTNISLNTLEARATQEAAP
jgi:endo-alpha-1,4-polygalactosaminidase (GH114 family)